MFRYWRHLFLLSTESHCVIMLRTIKLAGGGASAFDEAWRILTEKAAATAEIPQRALNAKSPLVLFVDYRKMVRSNLRRLAGEPTRTKASPPDESVARAGAKVRTGARRARGHVKVPQPASQGLPL